MYIQCSEPTCSVSSMLYFPVMDDPSRSMADAWNRRESRPSGGKET
jgi:hypothetical protein